MAPSDSMPVEVVSTDEFKARTQPQKPEPAPAPETPETAGATPAEAAEPARAESTPASPPEPAPAPSDAPPAPESPPETAPEPETAQPGPPAVPKPRAKPELQVARAAQPEPEPEPESKPKPDPAAESPEPATTRPAQTSQSTPPRPQAKPRVRLEDAPEQKDAPEADQLTSILKDVESELSEETQGGGARSDKQGEAPARTQQTKTETQPEPTPKARDQLSASQIANVRRQLQDCWRVPAGAKNAANLVVEIAVQLNRDGSVRHAEIATTDRMNDSFYRAAAESALRAVNICSPLDGLPVDKYGTWQRMRLTFDPEEMFGS
jgi:hypothetical protein